MDELKAVQVRFRLPATLAQLLLLLVHHPIVTAAQVENEEKVVTSIRVAMNRLRARFKEVPVQSRRGVGYWIDPDDRRKLNQIIQDFTKE